MHIERCWKLQSWKNCREIPQAKFLKTLLFLPLSPPKAMLNSIVSFSHTWRPTLSGVGWGKVIEIISCVFITKLPGKVWTLFVLIVVWLMNGIVDWWSDWWLVWLVDLFLRLLCLIHWLADRFVDGWLELVIIDSLIAESIGWLIHW